MPINAPDEQANQAERELLGKKLSNFVIAYITCPQDSAKNYLGGILLTDYRTRPKEFAFVSPVRVTLMQKIIHGRTLDEAVVVDVVAQRLLTEASKQPDIIFVDSDVLLELQQLTKIPVAKLSRDEKADSQSASLSTLKFTAAPGPNKESRESEVDQVLASLEQFNLMDPLPNAGGHEHSSSKFDSNFLPP